MPQQLLDSQRGDLMASVTAFEHRGMSIGRVFQRAFSAIGFNPLVILGLALVIGALPGLLMTYLFVQLGLGRPAASPNGLIDPSGFFGAVFLSSIIGLLLASIVQAALTRATVSASEGVRATFAESLATGFRVALPLIGLTILFSFGVMIGLILLFVPGIILLTMWAVAIPALVVERHGVGASFRRSAQLTKGARWKIFGLFLVLLVIYWLFTIVAGLVGLGMYSAANSAAGLTVGNLLGSVILGTIINTVWGTIQPSLYVELRQWKEGGSLENLQEVFA
jgi:Membrane domain of glycerophosphoryl diester phosphodiesterase